MAMQVSRPSYSEKLEYLLVATFAGIFLARNICESRGSVNLKYYNSKYCVTKFT